MLIYFNTGTHYAHFRGNPLYQAKKNKKKQNKKKNLDKRLRTLNNERMKTKTKQMKKKKKTDLVLVGVLQLVLCLGYNFIIYSSYLRGPEE